jgi:hypothetical protein
LPYAAWHQRRLGMVGRVLLIAGFLAGCHLLTAGPEPDTGVEARSETGDVSLLLRAKKQVFAQGEPLELTLEVMNQGPRPVTLRFPSAQRNDLLIHNAQGQEVWRWSSERMFAQVLGVETLAPNGGKLTYHVVMRETLPRGTYTVIGVVPAIDAHLSARLEITFQ